MNLYSSVAMFTTTCRIFHHSKDISYYTCVTTPASGHPLGATHPFSEEQLRCDACVTTPPFGHPLEATPPSPPRSA